MTVGIAGKQNGELLEVKDELPQDDGSSKVTFAHLQIGQISPDLAIGADVTRTVSLKANELLASTGLILGSRGFVLSGQQAEGLFRRNPVCKRLIFPLRHGEDINGIPRGAWVIDTNGWSESDLRDQAPEIYQHLYDTVYRERQSNRDPKLRKLWWLFRRSNEQVRGAIAGLFRYIATVETSKHRVFVFLDAATKPEHKLIIIGSDDAFHLGVLNSRIHVVFALSRRAQLGPTPVYAKTDCFDPFPFPVCGEAAKAAIRKVAEELDAHRKRVQAKCPAITLTGMYNVLEKLRANQPLTPKEQAIHEHGLVSVLRQLHDDLDAAVFAAYGWPVTLTEAEILERLVALNAERAKEEAQGIIRWLRPEYQASSQRSAVSSQKELTLPKGRTKSKARKGKQSWPKPLAERVGVVESALRAAAVPLSGKALAKQFKRAKPAEVEEILETLCTLGRIQRAPGVGLFIT